MPSTHHCSIADEALDDGRTTKALECMVEFGSDRQEAEYSYGKFVHRLDECPNFELTNRNDADSNHYLSILQHSSGDGITNFEVSYLLREGGSSIHLRVFTR